MAQEQFETPLEKFRKKIRTMKEEEFEKKRRAESGEKGVRWNPHFERIDPETLGEDDWFVFENIDRLSMAEFENLRRKRMEDLGIIQSPEEAERIMAAEGLTEEQRRIVRRVIKGNGGYLVSTPEQESVDYFWQYMANKFISAGGQGKADPS